MRYGKYHSAKCRFNEMTFDSKKELSRYIQLSQLERVGTIQNLQRQVKYILIPTQFEYCEKYGKNGNRLKDGKKTIERECAYIADFVYTENGKLIVEDVKGIKTKDYVIKRKLMLYVHGIKITEV